MAGLEQMTTPTSVDESHLSSKPGMCLLQLQGSLQAWSAHGTSVLPKSRKGRALLALLALSDGRPVSRQLVAATLWSGLDRATGLARLRDMLHDLRKEFAAADISPLEMEGDGLALPLDAVRVESDPDMPDAAFLIDLDDIDPAFDRWLLHVRERRRQARRGAAPDAAPATTRQSGPSILIAEFDTDRPEDGSLARAVVAEVAAALSRFRWFRTIASPVQGARPTADYVLSGTLQRGEDQYRLLLKLVDLDRGNVVWTTSLLQARRGDFDLQERFANTVAARLDPELLLVEAERQRGRPLPARADPYSLVLRAVPAIFRLERNGFFDAGHMLEQAIAADRDYALAHGWLAYWHMFLSGQGWASNRFQTMTQAGRAAERAMMLDPKDAQAVTITGHVKAFLLRQIDEATALHELALQINPGLPLAWHFAGMTHAYAGRLEEADRCIRECCGLAPTAPHAFFAEGALGIVHLLRADHEAAVTVGRRVTERHPRFTSAFKSYLAALGHLRRHTEAAGVLRRLLEVEPDFSLRQFRLNAPYQRAQELEHFSAGLRLAGVS